MASTQQKRLIELWEGNGYIVVNLIRTNCNGISDLVAFKNKRAVFIESKEPGDVVSPLQQFRLQEFYKQGFDVYINETKFKDFVK